MMDMFAMTLLEVVLIKLERTATSLVLIVLVSASEILLTIGTA